MIKIIIIIIVKDDNTKQWIRGILFIHISFFHYHGWETMDGLSCRLIKPIKCSLFMIKRKFSWLCVKKSPISKHLEINCVCSKFYLSNVPTFQIKSHIYYIQPYIHIIYIYMYKVGMYTCSRVMIIVIKWTVTNLSLKTSRII